MSELVSILIPAHNAEKWISDTIRSALSQTWPRKEIIIVDDGSSDGTFEVARQFEAKSVNVISQENKGGNSARNRAYSLAQGDYVQWLDADDLLASDKITEQMKVAETSQSKMVLYSCPHGVFLCSPKRARFVPNSLWHDLTPVECLINRFYFNDFLNPASYLVSRELAEKGGPWDERLSCDQDGEYYSRIIAASDEVKFVSTARCYYRQSSFNQVSRRNSEETGRSLLLAKSLSIRCLMSLADTDRTRKASLALLQHSLPYFYPEKTELIEKINKLAFELGGNLEPPNFGWRSEFLQRILGTKKGKESMIALRKLKMAASVKWDEIMYKLER
jgi:glycosyltransferase involved in cell wall biosynthesis